MSVLVKIYGLLAILAFTMALATSPNAMVPAGPREFQPARCGETASSIEGRVLRVCLGQFAGHSKADSDKAVQVELNDSRPVTFRVAHTASNLIVLDNGATTTSLFLENAEGVIALLKITSARTGELLYAYGNFDGEAFYVPKFENVFKVQ